MANRRESGSEEVPPFSRLFIIHDRGIESATIREAFEKYGTIQDLHMVKDRRTLEPKGFSYVKFERTSDAALAMEKMNGLCLDGSNKKIKVVLANSKDEGSYRDPLEDEKMLRIFVVIPKDFGNRDLRKSFEEFGDIEYVNIVRDRKSGDPKGFGYVKFRRAYHAALAIEKSESKFKAKFADPPNRDREGGPPMKRGREQYDEYEDRYRGPRGGRADDYFDDSRRGYYDPIPPKLMQNRGLMEQMQMQASMGLSMNSGMSMGLGMRDEGGMGMAMGDMGSPVEVEAMVTSSHVVRPQLHKLFDLIPGLEFFNYNKTTGLVVVRYATPEAAARCVEKMSGLEYPPGNPIGVRYARGGRRRDEPVGGMSGPNSLDVSSIIDNLKGHPNAGHLIGAMKQIANIMDAPSSSDLKPDGTESVPYCNISLPRVQPRLAHDSECKERLFIVCKPFPINEGVLNDAFCRFGNLIEVFLQPGKNFGYARYGCKESANKAIDTLNMCEINGQLLKVLVADAPRHEQDRRHSRSPDRKRTRNSEHWES